MNHDYISNLISEISVSLKSDTIPVYSVMVGRYDVISPIRAEKGFKFFLFTDQDDLQVPAPWVAVSLPRWHGNPALLTRAVKILGHKVFPASDASIYMDASFRVNGSLLEFVNEYCSGDLALFTHPNRSSVRSEIDACIRSGKETSSIYSRLFPEFGEFLEKEDTRLFAAGFLYRRLCCIHLRAAMEEWFRYVNEISMRDQITLPYVLRSNNVMVSSIPLNIFYNKHVYPKPHCDSSMLDRARLAVRRWLTS